MWLVAVAATLGTSLPGFTQTVDATAQAAIVRTSHAPHNLSATARGPARVALSWQAPTAAAAQVTGYGIQYSQDDGANWSVLPTVGRGTTSFVHTTGLAPGAAVLYRVFAIGANGAGPAATATVDLPRNSVPRITELVLNINPGSHRWYPPRGTVDVTVRFDQAVTVRTGFGVPSIDLVIGRPPHRQAGFASDYLGGSGTDRLTFRYTAPDWHLDLSDIAVGADALRLNGGRIANYLVTHSALLVHGPVTLDYRDQVNTQSRGVLVMGTTAPAPAAPVPELDPLAAWSEPGVPEFAAMLTAAAALVAGTGIVQELGLAEGFGEPPSSRSERLPDVSRWNGEDPPMAIAVDLGGDVGRRAPVIAGKPGWLTQYTDTTEPSYARTATTEQMTTVSACEQAFWSTAVTVGTHHDGYLGYEEEGIGGTNPFGEIQDDDFSIAGTRYTVISAYFDEAGAASDYHFNVSSALPSGLTLHIGSVELPFSSVTSDVHQPGPPSWYAYRWESAEYSGTFDHEDGDSVTVCLTGWNPGETLSRNPGSISGSGGSSTVSGSVGSVGLGLRPKINDGGSGTAGAAGEDGVYTEGERLEFFVERISDSGQAVTIGVTVTQDGDFISGSPPTVVTLGQHETRKDIVINTDDDAIVESDGSVSVTISCDCAVTTGTLQVEILNNDSSFTVRNAEAVESEGQITFTVTKGDSLRTPMTLHYETRNGSATAGSDFTAPAAGAVLTIQPDNDTAAFTIDVTDDTLVESDESFRVRLFHPLDGDVDMGATGTIKDDDSALANAWLARFGRTVASHVVESVDARLSGQLGPVTQVTLGGTMLPSTPPPVQPDATAAIPHTSMEGGEFLSGSSFQVLATDVGLDGTVGTGLTMWGRGSATGLQGRDEIVTVKDGQVGTGTFGVDYDWGGALAGLAVAYSGGGADYRVAGGHGRADKADSWLISAHPYAQAQVLGDRLTAWGLLGYGLGQMTLAEHATDEETGISMMMGALGLRGVLSPETNRFGFSVKSDAFVTRMTAGEGAVAETGAHRARLLAEGTHRMDFGSGGVLIPRLVTGVRYDFGDVETGFGAEMGGGVSYAYPEWGLTAAANVRVLLTHQDSGFEQWGGGGSLLITPGAAGLGPSVAVNTSLGAMASGAQRLWTSGVAFGPPAAVPGSHIDAEMGYGLAVDDGDGMVTPYVGMAVAEKGARVFRLGARLSTAPSFSLSVVGERREESAGAATHGVSVNGALHW